MKNLNYDLFKILIAVAESKNFYEAAEKLSITQPSVSLKLKELEGQLPLPIFQLEGKRKVLTYYGRSLYDIAKAQDLQFAQKLELLHRQYADGKRLCIRIAGRNEILEHLLPRLQFEGKIELIYCSSADAIEKLQTHDIDVAISYSLPDSTELLAKKLFQSKSYFVIHNRLLGKRKLNLELINDMGFLTKTPCVIYHRDGHMLNTWLKHLDLTLEQMDVRFIMEDWRSIQYLVDLGHGYSVVPEYVLSASTQVSRFEMPTRVLPAYTFYALFEKGLKQIKPFQKFLEF